MNKYELLLKRVEAKLNPYVTALLAILYYAMSPLTSMTAEHLEGVMDLLGYTYNKDTNTFNDGTTAYTIKELCSYIVQNYYEHSPAMNNDITISTFFMLKRYGYLTTADVTELISEMGAL
jgi:hypothetical protein